MIIRLAILQFGFELDTFPVLLSGTGPGKTGGSNLYPLQLVNFLEKNNTFHQRIPKQADVRVKYHRRERRERLEFGHFLMR
jgi:hypothetical protein